MNITKKIDKYLINESPKSMLDSYLIAALWSSNDDEGNPLDDEYSISDIDRKSISKSKKDINNFMKKAKSLLANATAKDDQIGHDFWLTRNGHGAGFWDREEIYDGNGDELSKIAGKFGTVYAYSENDVVYFD